MLIGSFASDPKIDQHHAPDSRRATWVAGRYEPPGKIVFTGETDGNVMAFFTPDLSEKWEQDAMRPLSRYDWTYLPLEGNFYVEVPRGSHVYLRGITWLTNAGFEKFEVPGEVQLSPDDQVVYVGEIRLLGGKPVFRNRADQARALAAKHGYEKLVSGWKVRLLKPLQR